MAKRGRPPLVENHPKRDEILSALLTPGANFEGIQRKFGISEKALDTFRKKYVTSATQVMLDRVATSVPLETLHLDVLSELANLSRLAAKMLSAADAWLEDPNAPGKYNLNPRTHEVDVVYEQVIPGDPPRTARKTEKLAKLMRDVEEGLGITVVKGETRTADPRKLLLDAVDTLKPVLELLGKATGQIKPEPPAAQLNVFLGSPDWARIEELLVATLRPWPPALEAAGKALAEIGEGQPGAGGGAR